MGNHEYCTDCGDSCFHDEGECNPQRRAKHQASIKAMEEANAASRLKTSELADQLRRDMGIEITIDRFGNAIIPWWQF